MSIEVTFYRQWDSFPLARERGEDDCIMVSVSPNAKGEGGNYEFAVQGVGSAGHREYIGARVCLFDDSWRALTDLPEIFTALAAKDTSARPDGPVGLDEVMALLADLGYHDETPTYVAQHEHFFRCACGEVKPS